VDWDGDGLDDLIVGDAVGYVNYFLRLPGGELTEMPLIEAGGTPIQVDALSAPVVTDWNADGLLDLMIGCASPGTGYGTIQIYVNEGSSGAPLFTRPHYVMCGPYALVESYTKPGFIDITGDGLKDVVYANGTAHFHYLENIGTAASPAFADIDSLTSMGRLIDLSYYGSICITDWNSDGLLDLLAGDFTGKLFLYFSGETGVQGEWGVEDAVILQILGNPARDRIAVHLGMVEPGFLSVSIFSLDGRRVEILFEGIPTTSEMVLTSRLRLPPGVYIVCARNSSTVVQRSQAVLLP